jgi:hypothetical protein
MTPRELPKYEENERRREEISTIITDHNYETEWIPMPRERER